MLDHWYNLSSEQFMYNDGKSMEMLIIHSIECSTWQDEFYICLAKTTPCAKPPTFHLVFCDGNNMAKQPFFHPCHVRNKFTH